MVTMDGGREDSIAVEDGRNFLGSSPVPREARGEKRSLHE